MDRRRCPKTPPGHKADTRAPATTNAPKAVPA